MAQPTDWLQTLTVDEPQDVEGLQMFALRWEAGRRLEYVTLDEALAAGTLEVTEINEQGRVPTLKVSNKAGMMAFLMAGEQLVGAKQNRVLNISIMVPGSTELPIPVSCVESGRWAHRSKGFQTSGSSSHHFLRKMMSKQVSSSYRSSGAARSDQGAVWNEVSRKLESLKSQSDTSALEQVFSDHSARLQQILDHMTPPQGACGAVFAFGGRIAGCDLFDKPETLAKLWPKLVRAYAIDALEETESRPRLSADAVREWLRSSKETKAETFKSAGVGDDVRLESPTLVGACLVVEEQPVHVEMFAEN